jgi:hypothetical protein
MYDTYITRSHERALRACVRACRVVIEIVNKTGTSFFSVEDRTQFARVSFVLWASPLGCFAVWFLKGVSLLGI